MTRYELRAKVFEKVENLEQPYSTPDIIDAAIAITLRVACDIAIAQPNMLRPKTGECIAMTLSDLMPAEKE